MEVSTTPVMDRLTHSVIKETSKNLKYYFDVKRRENAFILNTNSQYDYLPLRARSIYGTIKQYPPVYGSCYSDNDVKSHLRMWKSQRLPLKNVPEKKMCREELNFHMKAYNFMPSESPRVPDLRLKPLRSTSSCSLNSSYMNNRDIMRMLPNTGSKLTRLEQDQLLDDAANILAVNLDIFPTMVKSRRSFYESSLLHKVSPAITQTNLNDTPRHHKIMLYGTNGTSGFIELSQSESHRVPFLKGQINIFSVKTYYVGDLVGITIGHDRTDMIHRTDELEDGENTVVSKSSTMLTQTGLLGVIEKTHRRLTITADDVLQTDNNKQIATTNVETNPEYNNTLESQFRIDIQQRSPSVSAQSTSSVSEMTATPIQSTTEPIPFDIQLNPNIMLSKRRSIETIPVTPTLPTRPPARLEKRTSSTSLTSKTPSEIKQQSRLSNSENKPTTNKNEDDIFKYFD
ncbi:unnamed protein product [Didymodactylos carnosus]|uniref:Uncharacterized protein n=1 Tax=Didymodactylos carnosus TaxID=1234261 RepID=A0A813TY84_9BILA|nr:unnamed protein product [Didymodactylos carnosus]CAF3605339.1 unnamed protein product [Didymodactylos carnosus]